MCIISLFAYATQYSQNVGLSVAIVCMVNHTAVDLSNDVITSNHYLNLNESFLNNENKCRQDKNENKNNTKNNVNRKKSMNLFLRLI